MVAQPSPKPAREVTIFKLLWLLMGVLRTLVLKLLEVLEARPLVSMLDNIINFINNYRYFDYG